MKITNKFLTVAMGECWHEFDGTYDSGLICLKCDMGPIFLSRDKPDNSFYTPDGFFKLWNWAQTQEWWNGFYRDMLCNEIDSHSFYSYEFMPEYINPERFATAVYEFLKEKGL